MNEYGVIYEYYREGIMKYVDIKAKDIADLYEQVSAKEGFLRIIEIY